MAITHIKVEIDPKEGTRWVSIGNNHYPFPSSVGPTMLELELVDHKIFLTDNESYREFKERNNG